MKDEKSLQAFICKYLRDCGMLVYKFASPAHRGVPDLICIPDGEPVFFIEVKSPTGKGRLSKLQCKTVDKITDRGTDVYVINSKEQFKHFTDLRGFQPGTGSGG